MIVDNGLDSLAILGGGGGLPNFIAIGTGSATIVAGDTTLTTESDRNSVVEFDTSTSKQVTYISNFSAAEISGTTLTEFGLFNAVTGSNLFSKEVIGSVVFVGDRELQIQMTHRYSRSGA